MRRFIKCAIDHQEMKEDGSLSETIDVIIIGGGNAGATLAGLLGAYGFSVAVVEALPPEAARDPTLDGRTLAITRGSSHLYRAMGAWSGLRPLAQPITHIMTSQGDARMHYRAADTGHKAMGYIFNLNEFRPFLYNFATQMPRVQWFSPDQVLNLERTSTHVRVSLQSGIKLQASLCVAADGRHSPTRAQTNIRVLQRPYHQTAVVCTITHDQPHQGMALENFLPSGPFAALPMQGNQSSLVWSQTPEQAAELAAMDGAEFIRALAHPLGDVLGEIIDVGPRWTYPLGMHVMHSCIDTRLAFIADAAHGMHPVAGQGFNMGVRDIAALAEVLIHARAQGLDIGGYTVLEQYQRWRRFDNTLMIGFTDLLIHGFATQIPGAGHARRLGLRVIEKCPPLKKFFMQQAMGEGAANLRFLKPLKQVDKNASK